MKLKLRYGKKYTKGKWITVKGLKKYFDRIYQIYYSVRYIDEFDNNFFNKLMRDDIFDDELYKEIEYLFSLDILYTPWARENKLYSGECENSVVYMLGIIDYYIFTHYIKLGHEIPAKIQKIYKLFKDRITTWYSTTNIDKNEKDIKKIMKPYGIKKNNKYIEIEKELDNIYQSIENNISHNNFFYNLKTKNKIIKKQWERIYDIFDNYDTIYKMYHKSNFSSGYENRLKVYRLFEFWNDYNCKLYILNDIEIPEDNRLIYVVFDIRFLEWAG